jgi:hypothetical protein
MGSAEGVNERLQRRRWHGRHSSTSEAHRIKDMATTATEDRVAAARRAPKLLRGGRSD